MPRAVSSVVCHNLADLATRQRSRHILTCVSICSCKEAEEGNIFMCMARKIRTTVVLTTAAEAVLQRYRNNFGLKGPLSVGLMLFDALTAQEKIDRTRRIEEADRDPREMLGLLRDVALDLPDDALAHLTPDEGAAIRLYREAVAARTTARTVVGRAIPEAPRAARKQRSGR